MSKLEWTNIYESEDGSDPCWELPGVIEPTAGSSSGCSNCYPILDVSAEHRAIIVAAIAEATSNDSWAVFHE